MKKNILRKMALTVATFGIYAGSPCNAQEHTKSDQQKIDILYKKLDDINNITTYHVPDSLIDVQNRYIELDNFLTKHADEFDSLETANWNLYLRAYDKLAIRIGKTFQLSKYFKQWELDAIKKMLPKSNELASYDYVQKNAYARIMNNTASLADLLEWYSSINFNIVSQKFETKFLLDNRHEDSINYNSLSPIVFSNENINRDINKELMILLDCWAESYVDKHMFLIDLKSKKAISILTGDDAKKQAENIKETYKQHKEEFKADFIAENGGLDLPNFRIPEMQAIKKAYLKNNKKINQFVNQYNKMCSYEQRLQNFARQEHKRLSDSLSVLINRQNQHSK